MMDFITIFINKAYVIELGKLVGGCKGCLILFFVGVMTS